MKHPHGMNDFWLLFQSWKRSEKVGSNPQNSRVFWGSPVCLYYTVKAHIRHVGPAKWHRRQDSERNAWTLLSGVYTGHIRPRYHASTARSSKNYVEPALWWSLILSGSFRNFFQSGSAFGSKQKTAGKSRGCWVQQKSGSDFCSEFPLRETQRGKPGVMRKILSERFKSSPGKKKITSPP